MSTEIIAGNVPDILDIAQLPIGQYVSRGLLEDLYPYIDADPELSRDSFVPSILKALEINGGLYQVSPGFGIFTVIGRSDIVGGDMGWTLDQMMDCLAAQPEGTELFQQGITQDTMLQYICYMYMNDFVDWQSKTCSFDSPEFVKLLEFCAGFDQTFDYSEDTYESEVSRIQSGKQLLEITTETDFQNFQMYEAMFGGQITYKGFPCEHGVGNVAFTESGLAMTTSARIRTAHGVHAHAAHRGLSGKRRSLDLPDQSGGFRSKLADAMAKETYTDEYGRVEVSKGSWGGDGLSVDMYRHGGAGGADESPHRFHRRCPDDRHKHLGHHFGRWCGVFCRYENRRGSGAGYPEPRIDIRQRAELKLPERITRAAKCGPCFLRFRKIPVPQSRKPCYNISCRAPEKRRAPDTRPAGRA
jgi:hypothetical protein